MRTLRLRYFAISSTELFGRLRSLFLLRQLAICTMAAFTLVATPDSVQAQGGPKRVMILHSFGREFKPWSEYARAIRLELDRQALWPLEINEYSLEVARSSDEIPEAPFVEYLSAMFAKRPLDLIVSIGAPAAAFVQRHRSRLFPATPMVFAVVDQRRVQYSVLTSNDTVVAVDIDYGRALENILQVLPDTKNIAVVVGNSPIEKFWKEEIGRYAEALTNPVNFIWFDTLTFDDLLKRAADLPLHSAIFWELMIVDGAGVVHEEGKALSRLYSVANAPIFSYTDAFFGREIVGGPHVPVLEQGQKVAEVAMRILKGEKPSDIKVPPTGMAQPKFDWREMQRWGISEKRLPPGSEIHFRTLTEWESHFTEIVAISLVVLAQAALIGWLFYEHRRRREAEILARDQMSELTHMSRMAVAGELSASIAHEVNQPLTGIVARADAASRMLQSERPPLNEIRDALKHISIAGHRASEIVNSVRALFRQDMQPRIPTDINDVISGALAILHRDLQSHDIRIETQLWPSLPEIKMDRTQVQQVLLNLVMNASEAMHASSTRVLRIETSLPTTNFVRVSVEDTGNGFSAADSDQLFKPFYTTKKRGMGVGLSICRSVVESHGGRIWAEARTGGSAFHFELPIDEEATRTA
jgi:signal transduction histidine kinase/ABC-type uncharacterized transport system substrate-binding protein